MTLLPFHSHVPTRKEGEKAHTLALPLERAARVRLQVHVVLRNEVRSGCPCAADARGTACFLLTLLARPSSRKTAI